MLVDGSKHDVKDTFQDGSGDGFEVVMMMEGMRYKQIVKQGTLVIEELLSQMKDH